MTENSGLPQTGANNLDELNEKIRKFAIKAKEAGKSSTAIANTVKLMLGVYQMEQDSKVSQKWDLIDSNGDGIPDTEYNSATGEQRPFTTVAIEKFGKDGLWQVENEGDNPPPPAPAPTPDKPTSANQNMGLSANVLSKINALSQEERNKKLAELNLGEDDKNKWAYVYDKDGKVIDIQTINWQPSASSEEEATAYAQASQPESEKKAQQLKEEGAIRTYGPGAISTAKDWMSPTSVIQKGGEAIGRALKSDTAKKIGKFLFGEGKDNNSNSGAG